ncbi:tRNAPhe (7-(3-amino-3-carboxypropyl)wyosine37-C2)-hydroxylase, variant 2 [Dermatophagoides farinae]|uniref:tRNAPhe (7-(3-amino-3-carboxypropyl)wyosine37-C2)-hydroxylase, variant 2 n=1 Tax=Dermatophagoides farinae TaxID=6954 RepID=A0A922L482_DERFA|nr:tRNAPhe (7-(3-amino-3-carboxypropyl)wyosine37-C2)-hydroxylase, variant 2 [Dermatophagoides farinae]
MESFFSISCVHVFSVLIVLFMKMTNHIETFENLTSDKFDSLVEQDLPFIIRQAAFGSCLRNWNKDYFGQKIASKQVSVHVSTSPLLDFINKNFSYCVYDFIEFLKLCSEENGLYYYLRSIGNHSSKEIANLSEQFPEIANDVEYPEFINFCAEENCPNENECPNRHLFSSVLRISSRNLSIWTHYDVMENILLQIIGRKKVILFPPTDAPFLYLKGDKSEIIDLEAHDLDKKYPMFNNATRYECILEPGDSLFIPSMWFHNTKALEYSIGVNFFWKNPQLIHHYDRNDFYGNKDLKLATHAYVNLDKALQHLNKLPDKYRKFYISMCIAKLNKSLKSIS